MPVRAPEQAKPFLGCPVRILAEYRREPTHVESLVYPRLTALSEGLWSPEARQGSGSFMVRLPVHRQRLGAMNVKYRDLDTPKTPVP
ncbi:MAG: family 20 glycosylhydrolase [Gemmatimonas sp.]|nr:family 20 glycosylhydrolase [Gemmatimonas sp.]